MFDSKLFGIIFPLTVILVSMKCWHLCNVKINIFPDFVALDNLIQYLVNNVAGMKAVHQHYILKAIRQL